MNPSSLGAMPRDVGDHVFPRGWGVRESVTERYMGVGGGFLKRSLCSLFKKVFC